MAQDLPPRLSDRQKAALAIAAELERESAEYRADSDWYHDVDEPSDALPVDVPYRKVSQRLADEFNGRHSDHMAPVEERVMQLANERDEALAKIDQRDDLDEEEREAKKRSTAENFRNLIALAQMGGENDSLTPEHRASTSRSMARLEERGLLERTKGEGAVANDRYTKFVKLSDEGRAAGRELLRRARDGRYGFALDASVA